MFGKRIYLCFGLIGVGAAIALAMPHLGHGVLAPFVLEVASLGAMLLLLYGALARRLAVSASIVLHMISASISAAGVGIIAMLPIGTLIDGRRARLYGY